MLKTETLHQTDHGTYEEPDGEFLEVLNEKRDRLRVLTRVEEPQLADEDDEPDYPTNDDGDPLCVGKEDGQCSRTVDEPGDTCWQHDT